MRNWNEISEAQRAAMAERFAGHAVMDTVFAPVEDSGMIEGSAGTRPPTRRDLYHYLTTPGAEPGPGWLAMLRNDQRLCADLDLMTDLAGLVTIGRAVAADTSDLNLERQMPPARVSLRPTARSDREVYLIVENPGRDPGFRPVRMVVNRGRGDLVSVDLPGSLEEPLQLILPVEHPLVAAVADAASTITFT